MNFRDPDSMNYAIGKVLRYGVIASGMVIILGIARLAMTEIHGDASSYLTYNPSTVPHGVFSVSFSGIVQGLEKQSPFSIIEVGVIILIATPVLRVLVSVLLFEAEGDRQYVFITAVVLALLLFSMLVAPYIPVFHA